MFLYRKQQHRSFWSKIWLMSTYLNETFSSFTLYLKWASAQTGIANSDLWLCSSKYIINYSILLKWFFNRNNPQNKGQAWLLWLKKFSMAILFLCKTAKGHNKDYYCTYHSFFFQRWRTLCVSLYNVKLLFFYSRKKNADSDCLLLNSLRDLIHLCYFNKQYNIV